MKKEMHSIKVNLEELRYVIEDTHHCKVGGLAEVVDVRIPRRNKPTWEGPVHVFEIGGHPKAARCYAWPEPVNKTTITIRAVLHSDKISSAQKAVHSVIARKRNDQI